jgi:hypothetical protein
MVIGDDDDDDDDDEDDDDVGSQGNEEMYIDLRWDVFLGTYYHWRLIKGTSLVPWDFVVPDEAPWPYFCRGVELGRSLPGKTSVQMWGLKEEFTAGSTLVHGPNESSCLSRMLEDRRGSV